LFREVLGDMGKSTFARHLKLGLLPKPDKKLGPLSMCVETSMAEAVAALPSGRASKSTTSSEQAVA
jgi:hypothetical protein